MNLATPRSISRGLIQFFFISMCVCVVLPVFTVSCSVMIDTEATLKKSNIIHLLPNANIELVTETKEESATNFSTTLPDTGQTTCYDDAVSIPCPYPDEPLYGQDASYSISPVSYADEGAVVTDNVTGLMWQKEDDNNPYNWYEATGTADSESNRGGATDVCGSLTLGGYSGWRLPTLKELATIVNLGSHSPAIDKTKFPNTNSVYWSSTTLAIKPIYSAWWVNFNTATIYYSSKSSDYYVRCVRGDPFHKNPSYKKNNDGTVKDNNTGLTWQQDKAGTMMIWESAVGYCEWLSLGGKNDWRLPNYKELQSLANYAKYDPTLDTTYFTGIYSSLYWTSTTSAYSMDKAWHLDFYDGYVLNTNKSKLLYVRCVRSGQ